MGSVIHIAVNQVQVNHFVTPASLNLIISFCQSVGVQVNVNTVAFAIADNSYKSVVSMSTNP